MINILVQQPDVISVTAINENEFNVDITTPAPIVVEASGQSGKQGLQGDNVDYALSTGVTWGLGLQIHSGDTSKFDILPGEAIFIDNFTTPGTIAKTILKLPSGISSITPVWGTGGRHPIYITLDKDGIVHQSLLAPTPEEYADIAYVGVIAVIPALTTIAAVYQYQFGAVNSITRFEQLCYALGSFNIVGNIYSAISATPTLSIKRSSGKIFRLGSNMENNPKAPDIVTTTEGNPELFFSLYHQAGEWFYNPVPHSNVDPEYYDNGSSLVAMTPGYFQIKTKFYSPSIVFFQYGQKEYASMNEAINGVNDNIDIYSILVGDFVFRGWIVIQQGCTDLHNFSKCKFIAAGKFGLGSSTSEGGSGNIPPGGLLHQVLRKAGNGDYDIEWGNNYPVGLNKEVQFNDNGSGGSDTDFTFDKDTKSLSIGKSETLPNNPLGVGGNVDSYLQTNIKNKSDGISASSDYVATANDGTDEIYYANMGVNGSNYANEDFSGIKAHDGYMIANGSDLALASSDNLNLLAGGFKEENIIGQVKTTGIDLVENMHYKENGFDIIDVIKECSSKVEEDAAFLAGSKIIIRTDLI